jgi:hypothetical protein
LTAECETARRHVTDTLGIIDIDGVDAAYGSIQQVDRSRFAAPNELCLSGGVQACQLIRYR